MKRDIIIAPSLLSANFANLESDIKQCENGGADILHIDVMDGHFVPNITIGPLVVNSIRKITALPLDCHLMISEPDKYIQQFAEAGAKYISVHAEVLPHLHRTLSLIKSYGVKAGIALNPVTPLEYIYEAAEFADFVLLMSVNPGFGGQKFIHSFLIRCEKVKNYLINNSLGLDIQVDGGVKAENAEIIVRAGANMLVCGSGIFSGNIIGNINSLRTMAERGRNLIV